MSSADRWILPEGVEELLPEEAGRAEVLRRRILDLYRSWGYELIIPPLMEFTESLLVGLGQDMDLQTFRVTDQLTGRMMGLRADITPQAARIDAHSLNRSGPVRLCYAGSVLHTRKKNPLASRSPIQLGAELFGADSAEADLEIISLMLATLQCAGLEDLTLDLGHVGLYAAALSDAGLSADVEARYFDALQRKSETEIEDILSAVELAPATRERLQGLATLYGDAQVLQRASALFAGMPDALAAIDALASVSIQIQQRMPSLNLYFDLAELRGYHYHTGLVFAALTAGHGEEIALGGRYDDIGAVFGRARPATGFSIDLKALLALGRVEIAEASAIAAPPETDDELWRTVQALREAGETVVQILPGEELPSGCDRQLVKRERKWCVQALERG